MTAASTRVTPKIIGAKSTTASTSNVAGTNAISTAGRPTRFKSPKSSDRPARSRISISASFRRSPEMDRMVGSSRPSAYGPMRMPTSSMPMMRGSFIFSKTAAPIRPKRNTNAKDANIEISFWAAAQIRLRDNVPQTPFFASRLFE